MRKQVKPLLLKSSAATFAALLTAGVTVISLPAVAATAPLVSISNIPLTLVAPAHPQVLLAITNSESMDGDLSGAIMTGSGSTTYAPAQLNASSSPVNFNVPTGFTPPVSGGATGSAQPYTTNCIAPQTTSWLCDNSASRLNVAKAAISAILQTFVGSTDFGLLDYSTSSTTLYNTWLYVMSEPGGFTFSNTNTPAPANGEYVANPCYNLPSGSTVYNKCATMATAIVNGAATGPLVMNPGLLTMPYMLVQYSSDDPSVNDVLYSGAGSAAPVCLVYGGTSPATPYPPNLTLSNYNSGGSAMYVTYAQQVNACARTVGPTNAGFVPYQDQTMYIQRGFGYGANQSANSGNLALTLQTAGNNPTPAQIQSVISKFTPYLAPETNSTSASSSEIKALAGQSPTAGMLTSALAYFKTNPASSNGCPPNRYVILLTDGLPTESLNGKLWPPLGSYSAIQYGETASFDAATGALVSTNDGALSDTISELTALANAGVKTYIIGLGAGVDPTLNPQAAATMTAMAVAGNTGSYYAATSPAAVALDMTAILTAIGAANMSTSSAAVNSTGLNLKSVAYQAQFTSATNPWQDWTGNLAAYPLTSTGVPNTTSPRWLAATQLDAQVAASGAADRIIATWNPVGGTSGAGAGVPFEWPASVGSNTISSTQESELQTSATDMLGPVRLAYLRGDQSQEQQHGGAFRSRSHLLGDIVDSNPVYVGAPAGPYQSASYLNFEIAQQNRAPMIYVGANDGMLHAIDPTTGNAKFAFIPNGVFANLINLTKPTYNQNHQFFVDGSPTEGDVQFSDGSWHTILTGGLNAGGHSIYALDITNPSSITSESALASDVLWEYSDPSGLLGLTYSEPFIAYTSDASSPFVVFFGSGYNNSDGNPYLYAVNAQTGALITRINLCASVSPDPCNHSLPNGLASPVGVNSNGALYLPDDTVYAGDLQGNLWKVNISSANPTNWSVQLLFQARDASGNMQPITVAPQVSLNPQFPTYGGTVVYFGTGQLLGAPDLTTTGTQTFYGIWDKPGLTSVITRSNLQSQTLSGPVAGPGGTMVGTATANKVNWATQDGWYDDLPASGERVVSDPRLESGAVVFTTYVPATNSCAVGGQAQLVAVNFATGGAFPRPELDINGDGKLNSNDQVDGNNPVSLYLGSVYAASPTVISASLGPITAVKLVSESSGAIRAVGQAPPGAGLQSWRELPPGG